MSGCGECGSGEQAELLRSTMVEVAVKDAIVEEAAVKNAMAD